MKLLVCGGRNYANRMLVFRVLDMLHKSFTITQIIHGAASGADTLADDWANSRRVAKQPYPADWKDLSHQDAVIRTSRTGRKYDARAGHRRNKLMLDQGCPDAVLAFPGGAGTADMVAISKAARIKVFDCRNLAT